MRLIDADELNAYLGYLYHWEGDVGRQDVLRKVMWKVCHLPTQPIEKPKEDGS